MASLSKTTKGGPAQPIVIVVDDDADLRDALADLFQSVGLEVAVFGSAQELLQAKLPDLRGRRNWFIG